MSIHTEKYLVGVALMLLSAFCIALNALSGKQLLGVFFLPILIFLRFFFPALFLAIFNQLTHRFPRKMKHFKLHVYRAIFMLSCQIFFLYYLVHGSLFNATLLFMTSHLFVPLISRIVYHTTISRRRWLSLVVGFLGVILIFQPTESVIHWQAFIGLMAGLLNACSQLVQHKQSNIGEDPTVITCISFSLAAALSLIILLPGFLIYPTHLLLQIHPLTYTRLWIFGLLFILTSIANQLFRSHAYRHVEKAATLSPFAYSVILFSSMIDWLFYDKVPNILASIGGILIFGSTLFICKFSVR